MRRVIAKKPERERFYRRTQELVLLFGGDVIESRCDFSDEYRIDTRAGEMTVYLSRWDVEESRHLPWTYCKFKDAEAGKRFGASYPSGKCNQIYYDDTSFEDAEEHLILWLERVTGKEIDSLKASEVVA